MVRKKTGLILILLSAVLLLSGCAAAETEGHWFHEYFVVPFTYLIEMLGALFNNNYGLAIIAITIIVRGLLLPFSLNSAKKQKVMRDKMAIMKPEMDAIQARLKAAKTKEEQMKAQQEMMQLYQKYNFNPFAMGCLPMLLQIPIWMGLYYAIRISDKIAGHQFLWFTLDTPDMVMAVLAAIMYYFQFKVSMMNIPEEQAQQMKIMGFMSPIMILFASMYTASALAVYWFVSGLFLIGQTYLTKKLYPVTPAPAAETTSTGAKTSVGKGSSSSQGRKKR